MSSPRLRASVVCEAEGYLLVVRIRDPVTLLEVFFPPGGRVEPKESPPETAVRETLEETGLRVSLVPGADLVETYSYVWAGVDYDVTTHFFAATLLSPFVQLIPKVVDADYNLGAFWLPAAEALDAMSICPAIASAVQRVREMNVRGVRGR